MGRFTLSDGANPLPVHLLAWGASCKGSNVHLHWEVADPQNVTRYIAQQSDDAVKWEMVAIADATSATGYEVVDPSPASYYRLLRQEVMGTINYSEILRVNCGTLASEHYYLQQNPVSDRISVIATSGTRKNLQLNLIDIQGRTQKTQYRLLPSGVSTYSMDVTAFPSGNYLLSITDEQEQQVFHAKVVIQH